MSGPTFIVRLRIEGPVEAGTCIDLKCFEKPSAIPELLKGELARVIRGLADGFKADGVQIVGAELLRRGQQPGGGEIIDLQPILTSH